jgi:hypothetical protein
VSGSNAPSSSMSQTDQSQTNIPKDDRCNCCASFCRHGLDGCPNAPSVDLTVSAVRGSQSEGKPITSHVCDTCWACIQINLPNVFGTNNLGMNNLGMNKK